MGARRPRPVIADVGRVVPGRQKARGNRGITIRDFGVFMVFEPSRRTAQSVLLGFVPRAGADYARDRNYDHGPSRRTHVSGLSPWIRLRQLTEWEVVAAVLRQHRAQTASKFIDEVCWRTYWKGWLQLRPSVWSDYLRRVAELKAAGSAAKGVEFAVTGRTGIDCFDAWARELVETGYLHNHTRMWVASIWIHTLKLPWELGADWFLRHLFDGDPASNTLSWRWVAGLHTAGKSYLATRGNIRRYTEERFAVNADLAAEPIVITPLDAPPRQPLAEPDTLEGLDEAALLITDDDVSAREWITSHVRPSAVAGLFPAGGYADANVAEPVRAFRREALRSRCDQLIESLAGLSHWLENTSATALVMAEPPLGFAATMMADVRSICDEQGVQLRVVRHPWDEHFWPHATHGFFRFKKAIPEALEKFCA